MMRSLTRFLTRTKGANGSIGLTDVLAFSYLILGVLMILVPVLYDLLLELRERKESRRRSGADDEALDGPETARVGESAPGRPVAAGE